MEHVRCLVSYRIVSYRIESYRTTYRGQAQVRLFEIRACTLDRQRVPVNVLTVIRNVGRVIGAASGRALRRESLCSSLLIDRILSHLKLEPVQCRGRPGDIENSARHFLT